MTKGYIKHAAVVPLGLLTTVLLSGLVLSSSIVSADNDSIVDEINITVPVSCTLSGTGMNTHNANINNGLYVPDIGSTTLHAFCNDNEGFAIYAAGYTGNEIGGTNSNKLVGTTASSNATIVSGTATTAGSPDISNWAMKLAISQDSGDTTSTNAFTIDSAPNEALPSQAESGATQAPFSSYHVVPNEYVKVAHKNSMTDMTATTGGVKLTTTYAAYISKTQPADTYSGQVIYTLVHPSTTPAPVEPNQIGVLFHGNGQTFASGKETNRVVYGDSYRQIYTTATPEIIETSNLTNGEQNGGYTDSENILETRTYDGAYKIKIEVDYDITGDSIEMIAFDGSWDGDWNNWNDVWTSYGWIYGGEDTSGTRTYMIDGDTVTIFADSWNTPVTDHNYGFSAKIYPLYTDEQENTTLLPVEYYIGNSPEIVKTPNIASDGVQNGAYVSNEWIHQTITMPNASKIKVVVKYGITNGSLTLIMAEGIWGGWDEDGEPTGYYTYLSPTENSTDTQTLIFEGNTITIDGMSYSVPEANYDYGFYAQIYPIYENEQEDTRPDSLANSFGAQVGAYAETTNFNGYWYVEGDNGKRFFTNESEIMEYIKQNANSLSGTTINLYAYNILIMQDVSEWRDDLPLESQIEAIDRRDGKIYTVAKLADGNVWMTQNLDHDIKTDGSVIYDNTTTDIGWNTQTNSYDEASWDPIPSAYTHNSTSGYDWFRYCEEFAEDCSYAFTPESYDPGDLYWDGMVRNEFDDSDSHRMNEGISQYHLGNFYNWTAAVAMNAAYDGFEVVNEFYNVEQSICPSGWTLPRSLYGDDSFYTLINTYDDGFNGYSETPPAWLRDAPFYYPLALGDSGSDMFFSGVRGFFWSSVGLLDGDYVHDAFRMEIDRDSISSDRLVGFGEAASIRCVARPVSNTLNKLLDEM